MATAPRPIHRWADRVYEKTRRKLAPFGAVVAWLEEQPHWQGALLLNQFTQIVEVSDPFPPSPGQSVDRRRPLREPSDILELLLHLQTIGFDVGKATTLDALLLVAERRGYHPVRSWLEGLKWDGQERIGRLFIDYFPAELPDKSDHEARDAMVAYLERIAACFMVAGVARIFEPGCKHDHLPVIVGPQRWGKSSGLAALMPSRNWFFDDLSVDLVDKDTKEALVGKWLIELAEFPHIKKEIEKVKAFLQAAGLTDLEGLTTAGRTIGRERVSSPRPLTASNFPTSLAIAVIGHSVSAKKVDVRRARA